MSERHDAAAGPHLPGATSRRWHSYAQSLQQGLSLLLLQEIVQLLVYSANCLHTVLPLRVLGHMCNAVIASLLNEDCFAITYSRSWCV